MSFASGFNSGINLTAQLRADARARRQEERQADLDAKSEARAKVADEAAQLQIQSIKRKMELEQKVSKRERLDRHASKIALSEFVKKAKDLDPDDVNAYADLFSEYRAKVVHPDVAASMNNIHSVYAANYADRKGTVNFLRKEARQKEYAVIQEKMADRGINVDYRTPSGQEKIMGFKRWDQINEQLSKSGVTWDQLEVEPSGYNLTVADYEKAERSLQKMKGEREVISDMSPQERQMLRSREFVNDPKNTNIYMKLDASYRGSSLSQNDNENVEDAMLAMELLEDTSRALDALNIPTGKGIGPLVDSLMSLAQQDASTSDFKASVQKLIPKLARGVFGEVGVLTDQDIENYKRTVASLSQSPEANELVMAQTQALIARGIRNKLERLASDGYNVSSYSERVKAYANAPTMVYRSADAASKNLYQDIRSGIVRPGERVFIWDNGAFMQTRAKPLSEYRTPNGR
jgi:hypothetical protein